VRNVFACAFLLSAGGLWRDEAAFVHLSLLPSLSDVWQTLGYDHCPILMPLAVRAWSAAGLGNTDLGLRALGLCVGLFFAALNKITALLSQTPNSAEAQAGVQQLPSSYVSLFSSASASREVSQLKRI
jgi:hypothetical protein